MNTTSTSPDLAGLDIPMDVWTQPFWDAAGEHRIEVPRCAPCGTFRWPPGPFCPACQSQAVEWVEAGQGIVYSFTVVRSPGSGIEGEESVHVAGLIEFPESGGVRLLAAIVDADPGMISIGSPVLADWVHAANAVVPVFRLVD